MNLVLYDQYRNHGAQIASWNFASKGGSISNIGHFALGAHDDYRALKLLNNRSSVHYVIIDKVSKVVRVGRPVTGVPTEIIHALLTEIDMGTWKYYQDLHPLHDNVALGSFSNVVIQESRSGDGLANLTTEQITIHQFGIGLLCRDIVDGSLKLYIANDNADAIDMTQQYNFLTPYRSVANFTKREFRDEVEPVTVNVVAADLTAYGCMGHHFNLSTFFNILISAGLVAIEGHDYFESDGTSSAGNAIPWISAVEADFHLSGMSHMVLSEPYNEIGLQIRRNVIVEDGNYACFDRLWTLPMFRYATYQWVSPDWYTADAEGRLTHQETEDAMSYYNTGFTQVGSAASRRLTLTSVDSSAVPKLVKFSGVYSVEDVQASHNDSDPQSQGGERKYTESAVRELLQQLLLTQDPESIVRFSDTGITLTDRFIAERNERTNQVGDKWGTSGHLTPLTVPCPPTQPTPDTPGHPGTSNTGHGNSSAAPEVNITNVIRLPKVLHVVNTTVSPDQFLVSVGAKLATDAVLGTLDVNDASCITALMPLLNSREESKETLTREPATEDVAGIQDEEVHDLGSPTVLA